LANTSLNNANVQIPFGDNHLKGMALHYPKKKKKQNKKKVEKVGLDFFFKGHFFPSRSSFSCAIH